MSGVQHHELLFLSGSEAQSGHHHKGSSGGGHSAALPCSFKHIVDKKLEWHLHLLALQTESCSPGIFCYVDASSGLEVFGPLSLILSKEHSGVTTEWERPGAWAASAIYSARPVFSSLTHLLLLGILGNLQSYNQYKETSHAKSAPQMQGFM